MNQIKKQLYQYKINKQHIENMLRWTPLEYAEFQWEMMEAFIQESTNFDPEALELYGKSEAYRKWWVNQWNVRDIANIEGIELLTWTHDRRAYYKHIHAPQELISSKCFAKSEAMIVGRVIDELHTTKTATK